MVKKMKMTVTTTIYFDNVDDPEYLKALAHDNVRAQAGEGLMTGSSEAEVDEWGVNVQLEATT